MRRIFVLLLLLFMSAPSITITYVLDQPETHVTYAVDTHEPRTFILPQDATGVTINGESASTTRITMNASGVITYTSQLHIEGIRRPYFVVDLSRIPTQIDTVTVMLPARAVLDVPLTQTNPSVHPRPSTAHTDGERMSFEWTGDELKPARAIFVRYDPPRSTPMALITAAGLFLVAISILIVATRLKRRVQQKTMNLHGAEKSLVKILLDAPEDGLWQNELVQKSGLSKVKVSRKLRNLEQKGVVQKIPHGNTNRIRLT